jgi:glycosyltransferase involved in cell wall biosynthesis
MSSYFISASLFPSPVTPTTGLFVAHRLNALKNLLQTDAQFFITSPTTYFPFKHAWFKNYALYAQKPTQIIQYQGFDVCYPRFLQLPATHSRFSGYFVYLSLKKYFDYHVQQYGLPKKMIAEYGFPDAVALYYLHKKYHIPYVVTLRGSDISYFMALNSLQKQILTALNYAETIICVSNNMKQNLSQQFNIPLEKIVVIGNGVDNHTFHRKTHQKESLRELYNIQTPYLISSVGGLIPRKNHELAIKAMQFLQKHSLMIAGSGDEYQNLTNLIKNLNLTERVFLIGSKMQHELCELYNASDLFLLCSLSEGRPNVVLEALACGIPVLTSSVSGVDELITQSAYGDIMPIAISPLELSQRIDAFSIKNYDSMIIENHAHQFSWETTAKLYAEILQK